MAFAHKRDNELVLVLSRKESAESGIEKDKRYDLSRLEKGKWLLVESGKTEEIQKQNEAEQKIIGLIGDKKLSERVEGKFEKLLSKEELPVLKKMLDEGKVIAFKLSDKYRKAVYKLASEKKKESEQFDAKEKAIEEYSLENDGFLVVKNEMRARKISDEMKPQINEGRVKGIKTFEGLFYIIENDLYQRYREQMIEIIKANKKISLPELSKNMNVSATLCKIVAEFLKDEGEIIEKTKESYCYISE